MSGNILDSAILYHNKLRRTLRLPPDELKRETRSSSRLSAPEESEHGQRPTPSKHPMDSTVKMGHGEGLTLDNDTLSINSVHSLHSNHPPKLAFDKKHYQHKPLQASKLFHTNSLLKDVLAHSLCGLLSLAVVAFFTASWISRHEPAGELHQLQKHFTSAANSIQDKLDTIDSVASDRVESYRKDMEVKIEQQANALGHEIDALRTHISEMGSALSKLQEKEFLSMDNALQLISSVVDKKEGEQKKEPLSLDDIKAAARAIIELELGKHEADGVARVDYALASGGGKIIGHSEGFNHGTTSIGKIALGLFTREAWKHPLANKVLEPSLGEPGQCLPLAGSNVHVDIALRTAIYPKEVTLEHVSKNVAYDISSAPKDFSIYGWEHNTKVKEGNWILLGEFSYDLEKHPVQTFNLSNTGEGRLFNRIRLHVVSNYGSQSHTCIYRLRVHGSEPSTKL